MTATPDGPTVDPDDVAAVAEAIHRARCCDDEAAVAWRFYIDHATVAVEVLTARIAARIRADLGERTCGEPGNCCGVHALRIVEGTP